MKLSYLKFDFPFKIISCDSQKKSFSADFSTICAADGSKCACRRETGREQMFFNPHCFVKCRSTSIGTVNQAISSRSFQILCWPFVSDNDVTRWRWRWEGEQRKCRKKTTQPTTCLISSSHKKFKIFPLFILFDKISRIDKSGKHSPRIWLSWKRRSTEKVFQFAILNWTFSSTSSFLHPFTFDKQSSRVSKSE